jgi:hypothetical protein
MRNRYTYLRVSPFRSPHAYEADRQQGLTTVAVDLAIMEALRGGRVILVATNSMRLERVEKMLRGQISFLPIPQPGWLKHGVSFDNGGFICLHNMQSGTNTLEGGRFTTAISDLGDVVDITGIPEGSPFDTRMFRQ